jgi:hypothetical protein
MRERRGAFCGMLIRVALIGFIGGFTAQAQMTSMSSFEVTFPNAPCSPHQVL